MELSVALAPTPELLAQVAMLPPADYVSGLAEVIKYGVIFFLLEKLGAVIGTTNLHIYAAMRGQSLEEFQKTRNAQVLYSVAGNDDSKKSWDKPVAR
mgnify:CR=1 FL=1